MRWFLAVLAVAALAACDAGPSAVLPDGESPAPGVQQDKTPVWAEGKSEATEQASMPVVEAPAAEAPSTGQVVITETRYGDWPLWSKNRKYSAYENATYHYEKHGAVFGAVTYEDWLRKVHGFIHSPPKGTQTIRRSNGDTLFYYPADNVFAVMTKQGAPRTMFKPDNGAAYWTEQKRIEAEKKLGRDPK